MSRLMPCRTRIRVSPEPNSFTMPLQRTASRGSAVGGVRVSATVSIRLPPEHYGGIDNQHPPEADDCGHQHDGRRHDSDAYGDLPGEVETAKKGRWVRSHRLEENGGEPEADRIADCADDGGLQHHHGDEAAVREPHRLEGGVLLQILRDEHVEGEPDYRDTDDNAEQHDRSEIHRDARIPEEVHHGFPAESIGGPRLQ